MTKKKSNSTSSLSVIVGISLVLLMISILVWMVLKANGLANTVKEQLQIDVYLQDDIAQIDIDKVKNEIKIHPFVKTVNYISKEEAWTKISKEIGEEALDILEYNPLKSSIEVYIKSEFVHPDSIQQFKNLVLSNNTEVISEVFYSKSQLQTVSKNIDSLKWIALGFSLILLLIAIALINNTIRLAIFSKRFLIRTMQLVGAKSNFIKRPFLLNSIFQGIVSSLLAMMLFLIMAFLLFKYYPDFFNTDNIFSKDNIQQFSIIFVTILIVGVGISFISTFFALNKYLRISIDKLYNR